jgi:hypothetical protein
LVAPTQWAKEQLVGLLESRTGRSVRLGGVSVRLFGGIRLTDLKIGSPETTDDPWLHAGSVQLDISPIQLFRGRLHPSNVLVDEARLRVLRRVDGSVEVADLIAPLPEPPRSPSARRGENPLTVQMRSGEITLIDDLTQSRVRLERVEGNVVCTGHNTEIRELNGMVNGGTVTLTARVSRTPGDQFVSARLRAENVGLDDGLRVVRYAIPVLSSAPLNLKGRLYADVNVTGRAATWDALPNSLDGMGTIALDPIDLSGAPLIAELSRMGDVSGEGRVGSIRTDFVIKDRRIDTDHFALKIGRIPLNLRGWTDFDGRVDYLVTIEDLKGRLSARARRFLGDLTLDVKDWATLHLRGTVDEMVVEVAGISLDRKLLEESGLRREDQERIKAIGRQLRERLLR